MIHHKRLIENFLSLSSLQAINYIVQLITIPYLTRVLGPEKYGLLSFAQAFTLYFVVLTGYGFNLSATRKAAAIRDDKYALNSLVSIVLVIQVGITFLSFIALIILCVFLPRFGDETALYLIAFVAVVGNVLFPVWFFQGMERMRDITIYNTIGKTAYLVILIAFVREESDYLIAAGAYSFGLFITALFAITSVLWAYKIRLALPKFREVISELREGWHVFVSLSTMNLYANSNTVILGFFAPDAVVGYYSAGEKIIKAIQGLFAPLSQAIYPHMSRLALESKELSMSFISKIASLVGGLSLLMSLALLIFASQLSRIILGENFTESIIVIQILSFYPFFSILGNIFSIQIMLNFGMERLFSRIVICASLINIALSLLLVVPLEHKGVSISLLIAEVSMMSFAFYCCYTRGYRPVLFRQKRS
jgi:PST family polysaccharide transporter